MRYKEHIHAICNNKPDTRYSAHILKNTHTYGQIENTMHIIREAKKGKLLNALKRYYIFINSKKHVHLNKFNIKHDNTRYKHMKHYNNIPHST
jgi:phage anti-repressor protein